MLYNVFFDIKRFDDVVASLMVHDFTVATAVLLLSDVLQKISRTLEDNRLRKFSREISYCKAITITRNMCAENLLLEFVEFVNFFLFH